MRSHTPAADLSSLQSQVAVLVPMKPLERSKSRLGEALDPLSRAALTLVLLQHVLRVSRSSRFTGAQYVAGGDAWVRRVAQAEEARWAPDPGEELNGAIRLAAGRLSEEGFRAVLVLPGDLGFLTSRDIAGLIEASQGLRRVVLAPATRDWGTNAILAPRGMLIGPSFGPQSFPRHLEAVERAGLPVGVVERPGLSFDLDTPEDLARYRRRRPRLEEALAAWRTRLAPAMSIANDGLGRSNR